ncbi:MAG: YbhN family protein [Candidatus Bruticola sp.]
MDSNKNGWAVEPETAPLPCREPHFARYKLSWGKILTGLGICLCLVPLVKTDQLLSSFSRLSWECFFLSLVFFILASAPASLVWYAAARHLGSSMSFMQSWRLSLIGFFWNNLIPGGVAGDGVRVWEVHKRHLSYAQGAASVFIERWSALAALIVISLAAWFMAAPIFDSFEEKTHTLPILSSLNGFSVKWSMLSVIIVMAVVFVLGSAVIFSEHLWQGLRYRLLSRFSLGASLEEFTKTCALIKFHWLGFLAASAINLLAPLLEAIAVYIVFYKICPHNLPIIYFLIFIPIFRLMLHLPISVNGIGTQEAAFAVYWGSVGMDLEPVLLSSFLVHAIKLFMCVLGALLYYLEPQAERKIQADS